MTSFIVATPLSIYTWLLKVKKLSKLLRKFTKSNKIDKCYLNQMYLYQVLLSY
ncbi:hypothetical protein SAMN06296008_1272 [Polynucleobacter kasalickyi]|uniref:Uncharacterized protein n=1 Tax=Polynucleobacter kasalickyi TaxID=1938817 RepID=A0A1W2CRX1_9BURK|nr:hypothetical protein SAMN06296008_1272 [Polynucleobacter kasalickyi]